MSKFPTFYDDAKGDDWNYNPDTAEVRVAAMGERANFKPAQGDKKIVSLLGIDVQLDFCCSKGGLFVAGAPDDSVRLTEFIYRELGTITRMFFTMDTHLPVQIFFSMFWVDDDDNEIEPNTLISADDVRKGKIKPNPAVAKDVCGGDYAWLQRYAIHYCETLERRGRYQLMVWPYHCLLGTRGHSIVGIVQEAALYHSFVRRAQLWPEVKGGQPLTENYSVFGAEVTVSHDGRPIQQKNDRFINTLLKSDVVIIAGQAKSHCVAWTIADLLDEIKAKDPLLVEKVYLLEDCTSSVVIPGVVDFAQQGNEAFDRFASDGMHVVKSTDPIADWPDVKL